MYKLQMVGFDARELWLETSSQWSAIQRQRYLLRPDVIKPLSVDSYTWYSIFSETWAPHIWKDKERQPIYRVEEWQDAFSESNRLDSLSQYGFRRVWTNLSALEKHLDDNWKQNGRPCAIVAIQEIMLEDYPEDPDHTVKINPETANSDWILLGYDVADYDLYSGLYEGEITEELSAQIKPEWLTHLNEYHLFTHAEMAFDYIDFANIRYPSHSPYYVYGLYLVQTLRVSLPALR